MSSSPWTAYDDVAATFRTVSEPAFFAAPAARLVELLGAGAGARLLDAGSGTGAVVRAARAAGADAVALDLSLPMLREGPRPARAVNALLPVLPFRAASFSHVAAAFVVSHLGDSSAFVAECARVLRTGGVAGVSSWARDPSDTPPGQLWTEVLAEAVPIDEVMAAAESVLPNERALAREEGVAALFDAPGWSLRAVLRQPFRAEIAAADYLRARSGGATARYARGLLGARSWEALVAEGVRRIESRLGARLEIATEVLFGIGERRA